MWVYTAKVVRMMNGSINPSPPAVKQQNFKILSRSFFSLKVTSPLPLRPNIGIPLFFKHLNFFADVYFTLLTVTATLAFKIYT